MAQSAEQLKPGRRASPPRVSPPKFSTAGKAGGNGAWTKTKARKIPPKKVVKEDDEAGASTHAPDKKGVPTTGIPSDISLYELDEAPIEVSGRILDMTSEGKVKRQHRFLAAFLARGTIAAGCREAQINRRTYYDWLDRDENFCDAMRDATEVVADDLEESALERAKDKSDILAIFLLKGMRHKYRDNFKGGSGSGKPEESEEKERVASSIVKSKLETIRRKRGLPPAGPPQVGLIKSGPDIEEQIAAKRLKSNVQDDEDDDDL